MNFTHILVYIYVNMASIMCVSCYYLTSEPSVRVVVVWVRVLDRSGDNEWQSHSITSTSDPQHLGSLSVQSVPNLVVSRVYKCTRACQMWSRYARLC